MLFSRVAHCLVHVISFDRFPVTFAKDLLKVA